MELLQIGIFKIFVAAKTPKKNHGPLKLLFLDGKKFGFMQIPSLSSELHGPQEPRCAEGGPPLRIFQRIVNLTKCLTCSDKKREVEIDLLSYSYYDREEN